MKPESWMTCIVRLKTTGRPKPGLSRSWQGCSHPRSTGPINNTESGPYTIERRPRSEQCRLDRQLKARGRRDIEHTRDKEWESGAEKKMSWYKKFSISLEKCANPHDGSDKRCGVQPWILALALNLSRTRVSHIKETLREKI